MPFKSFFQAGFECSTHKLRRGRRLDLIATTAHDEWVRNDYQRVKALNILTVREGLRWHTIEPRPGVRNFSSARRFMDEANSLGMEIIWDLLHFGWPDHQNPFDADWPQRFADFAAHFARVLRNTAASPVWIAPINEISFLAWAGGDTGGLNPFEEKRGSELKRQLVSAGITAALAIRNELPEVRFVWPDPVIHIVGTTPEVEQFRLGMFEAWDMLAGIQQPELGGSLDLIDVMGVNFYDRNQWRHNGKTIRQGEPEYRPFRDILAEVYYRYRKPILVSETGAENCARAGWMTYVCDEVDAAISGGIPIEGICWYPILNHPGWDDGRHCHNGLWDYPDRNGGREIYVPLAQELGERQMKRGVCSALKDTSPHAASPDVICLSHLRWEGIFQRPQHLMSRFANTRRVFFVEEPVFSASAPQLVSRLCDRSSVNVVTPHLPETMRNIASKVTAELLEDFFRSHHVDQPIAWFYTPMALDWLPIPFSPSVIAYDCMDELSLFRGAPAELTRNELSLFQKADVVFTGGRTLFEVKRDKHPNVHAFPSAVDVAHFARARAVPDDRGDQQSLPRPRVGFAGVIDERMDVELVAELARLRPDCQFVFLGPVVKIDPASLPQAANLHWLGLKDYQDLPSYFAGWDAAIMPFALNESTRFISPTKTPEYLAAGLPVVSTRIRDVVNPYSKLGLVEIADTAAEFAHALDAILERGSAPEWQVLAEAYVNTLSWDATWQDMTALLKPLDARPAMTLPTLEPSVVVHV